jgi:tRNA acetyltransferase TAN1
MCHELSFLLKEAGDPDPKVDKTGIRGLVVAKTTLNPTEAIEKLRTMLQEKPYEFRYAFRIIPIEKVVPTSVEEVKKVAEEFAKRLAETDTFRVTVEKRFTSIHSHDLIEAAATTIPNKVDLDNPSRVLLIEVLGGYTGMALVKPTEIISVQKEKML